jgi:hypothetical protein
VRAKTIALFIIMCLGGVTAHGQGMLSDMMSGKLVKPEVGAFAWYNLTDSATKQAYFLRQAIVGTERIKRKTAYWLETELVPKVGFPSVYKMLLTGPASNPKNVHRLLLREGQGGVQEIEVDRTQRGEEGSEVPRTSKGMESITLASGEIETEHFVIDDPEGEIEIWVSDLVKPMGLVRMITPLGELMLQRYGVGGKDGESAFPEPRAQEEAAEEFHEDTKPRNNFRGRRKKK